MDIPSITHATQVSPHPPERAAPAGSSAPVPPVSTPVQGPTAVQQPAPVPDLTQLTQAVKNINKILQEQTQGVEFSLDSDSHRTIIKVVDQNTKEVLRQIPSEEMLELSKALDSIQNGLIIRQKV